MEHDSGSLGVGERLRILEMDMRQLREELNQTRLELKGFGVKLSIAFAIVSFVVYALVEILFKK